MKTWVQLKTEIRNQIWPSGEAENLVSQHDDIFQEGAADISKWCECEQQQNVNLIQFCKTFYKCGMTVIPAPPGIVTRVFTVKDGDYCDPVFYVQREWPEPESLGKDLVFSGQVTSPDQTGKQSLPIGFKYSDSSSDKMIGEDIRRARCGIWSIHDRNIYISPWINSDELVVVEWKGIKRNWEDGDAVNEAQDYKKALKLYLQYGHERDYGSKQEAGLYLVRRPSQPDVGLYADALGDLIWQCREQTKVREDFSQTARILSPLFPFSVSTAPATETSFFNPVLTGHGAPQSTQYATPEHPDQPYLYKDKDSGSLWTWDTEAQAWV